MNINSAVFVPQAQKITPIVVTGTTPNSPIQISLGIRFDFLQQQQQHQQQQQEKKLQQKQLNNNNNTALRNSQIVPLKNFTIMQNTRPISFEQWSHMTQLRLFQQHQQQQPTTFYPQLEQHKTFFNIQQYQYRCQQQQLAYMRYLQQLDPQTKISNQMKSEESSYQYKSQTSISKDNSKKFKIQKQIATSNSSSIFQNQQQKPNEQLEIEYKCQQNVDTKHDTMQRNCSRASHNNSNSATNQLIKQNSQQHQQILNRYNYGKNDLNEAGLPIKMITSSHNNSVSQQSSPNHSNRTRKSRANNNHNNNNNNNNQQNHNNNNNSNNNNHSNQTSSAKNQDIGADKYPVNDWLETQNINYCYGQRFLSSTAEDNILPRRSAAVHRNSTSSEATANDDMNSCSSNEDLNEVYAVLPKHEHKKNNNKTARAPQHNNKRQQTKRKQPFTTAQNTSNNNNNNNNNKNNNNQRVTAKSMEQQTRMDVDETVKENQMPEMEAEKCFAYKPKHTKKRERKNNRMQLAANNALLTKSISNSSVCSNNSSANNNICEQSSSSFSSSEASPTASPAAQKRNVESIKKIVRALVPKNMTSQQAPLQLSETELFQLLRPYIVNHSLMRVYGYPVESVIHEGCVEIYKCVLRNNREQQESTEGVINYRDGLCASYMQSKTQTILQNRDSGQGSSDSSPSAMDSDSSELNEDAIYSVENSFQLQMQNELEKTCVRCNASFHVNKAGEYLSREKCVFHWGKLYQLYTGKSSMSSLYSCCHAEQKSIGCSRNDLHVWTGAVVGMNGPYNDFVHTRYRYNADGSIQRSQKVFALDCEMSFTGHGLDVTKVTLVGADGNIVYEHFVRPSAEIADYNTRFSGVTAQDLCPKANAALKTLPEVQHDLLELIDADSIVIGHGLDNDLRVLRIVHKTVVDTTVAFPHPSGFPYRRALKHLTRIFLGREIQNSEHGHSSYEDSLACLHLMMIKIKMDQNNMDEE